MDLKTTIEAIAPSLLRYGCTILDAGVVGRTAAE